jgi:hypothetical protein
MTYTRHCAGLMKRPNLLSALNTVRVKIKRMRSAGHVTHIEEVSKGYTIVVRELTEKCRWI